MQCSYLISIAIVHSCHRPCISRVMNRCIQECALQQTRALPSAIALGKEGFALGKEGFALGKAFVECCTRQRVVGISLHGKGFFAECRMSGTRQRFTLGKIKMRKKHENNSKKIKKKFWGRPPPASARPPPLKSLHFLRKIHG